MNKLTKFRKRIKITYAVAAASTCLVMMAVNPVVSERGGRDGTYYTIIINGKEEGIVADSSAAHDMITAARKEIARETGELVYMDYDYEIVKGRRILGRLDEQDIVKENIYNELKDSIVETETKAYTVKIDEFSVTLDSRDSVVSLLEAAKSKYDEADEFSVDLVSEESRELSAMMPAVARMEVSPNETEVVTESGEEGGAEGEAAAEEAETAEEDGILQISFEEDVEVVETYAKQDDIASLDEAIDMVTKDKETNKIYEVVSGDCLSVVAEKNNTSVSRLVEMNELLQEDSVIQVGDELVVTVPEPELSVVVEKQMTYDEEYQLPTEYRDNDEWYTNREEIVQEGAPGHREITAVVTLRNGAETGRKTVRESITEEARPTIIERGTQMPPSYIKPLSGGRFTSGFGARWGRTHKGIDWACPIGTAIKASNSGKVISAGWSNGYGYCVTIQHSDGRKTRYAHLSKILVSAGQNVSQGEKIALSGNTGNSTGPHVHFELFINESQVNPMKYLN